MSVDGMTGAPAWHAVAADLRARWAVERAAQREAWRRDGLLTDKTLHEHVLAGRDRYGDATLTFHRLESSVTYSLAALYDEATRVADGLAALGLKAGDVILVQSPSWQEAMLSFLAALRLGLVTTPVVHIYGPSEIGQIASRSGAKALILPQNWRGTPLEDRLEAQGPMPGVRHVVSIGGGDSTGHVRSWESLSSAGHPDAPVATGNATDVCALLYTSGTTSRPKGVLHTHESIAAEVLSNTRYLPSNERPGFLNALLAGHVGGLLAMMRPWFYGFNSVFMEKWDNAVAADLVRTHGLEWSNGTPFHLNGLLDAGLSDQNCRLQSYVVGAASVAPTLVRKSWSAGIGAVRSYGSTEHPTISTSAPTDPLDRRGETDGRPMPGTLVRIVDDAGRDLPAGTPGEIVSIGPEQMLGYTDPENNADAFTDDGWFRTGDIGVLAEDGFLTVVDRKKDIIIRGGENISSREIEDIMLRHPGVVDCAAVGVRDEVMGERVAMCVRLRDGTSLTLEDVSDHFAEAGVARQKTPERLVIIDKDFPRTPTGKILKPQLRDMIA